MRKIMFIVDGLADLPPSLVASRSDIKIIDIPIIAVKPGHKELIFRDLTADSFEDADELVQQGWVTKTSLPTVYQSENEEKYGILSVERATREALDEDYDVLYLAINSVISGTFNAVSALYNGLREENPNWRVECVDTECASTGLAMLLSDLLSIYDRGVIKDLDTAITWIESNRNRIAMVFSWFEFEYIKNSGKVKALPAILGKMFGIHPIGSVEYTDNERPLISFREKIRGTKRFFGVLARFISATIEDTRSVITVAHGNCAEKIENLIETIRVYLPEATILSGNDWRCGAAIQAHGGPTSVHINYHRKTPNSLKESELILQNILQK